jgi:DNA-binding NarL/FixJ family response regulator
MSKIKVLVADDHRIVAEGLANLLEPTYEIVAMVDNGHELIVAAKELKPQVIVADISMPLLNGIDAVTQIRNAGIRAKIVFLTMHLGVSYVRRALATGASAYVLKHSASSELLFALQEVLAGRIFITPSVAAKMTKNRVTQDLSLNAVDQLTVRQREVLQLLAEGHSAKESAAILQLSRRTVEYHKYHLIKVLGLHNSAELMQFAIERELVLQPLRPRGGKTP